MHYYARFIIVKNMAISVKTLKVPFLGLNRSKADLFHRLERLNTEVANRILSLPKEERRTLTSKSFSDVEIGSAWINQTIRTVAASKKARSFRRLPLETNNQNWTLHKVGETFSLAFGLVRGVKKRIPVAIHAASHREWFEALLSGRAKAGSLKLVRSRKRIWYACLSASMEVPDAEETGRWIGLDRGQNLPAVAATPEGPVVFWKVARIRHIRRIYSQRRTILQKAGKIRAVKKLERKERRIITHINHCLSRELVTMAKRLESGLRLEDLSGIRKTRQRRVSKSDAGQNRDYWSFFQLERFVRYKALASSVPVESVDPSYTTQTCHRCGSLNKRMKHAYRCSRCGYRAHADANASQNIRDGWDGRFSPLVLEVPADGLNDTALNGVRNPAS